MPESYHQAGQRHRATERQESTLAVPFLGNSPVLKRRAAAGQANVCLLRPNGNSFVNPGPVWCRENAATLADRFSKNSPIIARLRGRGALPDARE